MNEMLTEQPLWVESHGLVDSLGGWVAVDVIHGEDLKMRGGYSFVMRIALLFSISFRERWTLVS